jgi:uncharacterized membrane protein YfcA
MLEDVLLGVLIAFAIATVTTPVGVSGAVFLVPVQVSLLHTPSPALTPTNLLYNLVAIPGALFRFHHENRLRAPLTGLLVLGTLPGVVVGAVLRVEVLSGPEAFYLVVGAVLVPLGAWLTASPSPGGNRTAQTLPSRRLIAILALVVGVVGGVYGIGGGSILGPLLVGLGLSVVEVAPAALAATFITSIAGVATFGVLSLSADGDVAPDWVLGLSLGVGGLVGGYLGARLQGRVPEAILRRGLGVIALAVGVRYVILGAT